MRTFAFYPIAQRWWSLEDYGAVVDITKQLQAKSVLEFGPGSSTLSLIEGGATTIECCEDDPKWAKVYDERLAQRFPGQVTITRYVWADPLTITGVDDRCYDMALIDGPLGTERRPTVIRYAMERCHAVLVPTEDYKTRGANLRVVMADLAEEYGRTLEIFETGPLSGGFGLMLPRLSC